MVTKVQKLTHPTKSHRLRRLVYWFAGWALARLEVSERVDSQWCSLYNMVINKTVRPFYSP